MSYTISYTTSHTISYTTSYTILHTISYTMLCVGQKSDACGGDVVGRWYRQKRKYYISATQHLDSCLAIPLSDVTEIRTENQSILNGSLTAMLKSPVIFHAVNV